MSRPTGSKNKPKVAQPTQAIQESQAQNYSQVEQPQIKQTFSQSPTPQSPTPEMYQFAENFGARYFAQYAKFIENLSQYQNNETGYYNPIYANSALKRFNTNSVRPTVKDVKNWILNPREFETQLKQASEWLTYACEFYTRTLYYVANILNFDYELVPINPPNIDASKEEIELYKKQKKKNNDWLRKFKVKEQLSNIMLDVVRAGGKSYYLRHSDNSDYLQSMPDDYIYVNGRTDVNGYTYAMNMSFFYQYPQSIFNFAPEFADWYSNFLTEDGKFKNGMNPYKRMPIESSVVFKFDDTRPEMIPPFAGIFKNALEIEDYQDLLKLKAQLQTFQLLYLEIPKNEKGEPTIVAQEIANYVALAQMQAPTGTGIISTPMKLEQVKFDNSQNFNNIIGLGAQNYYQSSGLSPALFGDGTKSAVGITNGIHTDYLMFEHMYNQFERFINFQLSMISGKFNFSIRFLRRSNYKLDEDIKNAMSLLDHGGQVGRVLSAMGEEPWQQENLLLDNYLTGITNLLIVPQTAYTKSGKDSGGRPTTEDVGGNITDSNDQTRSDGGNADKKFSQNVCQNCGRTLDSGMFCNDDCKLEWAKTVIEESDDI